MPRFLIMGFGLYALLSAAIAAWVYHSALEVELRNDRTEGNVRLLEATSRLRGQLDVYRALANIAVDDPQMLQGLLEPNDGIAAYELSRLSLTYGAWEIDLTDTGGTVVASSATNRGGYTYDKALISAALNGRLGYAIDIESGERLVRFSRAVKGANNKPKGTIVISASLAALEFQWPVTPEPFILFDRQGVSLSSNRPELLLLSRQATPEFTGFPLSDATSIAGATLWRYAPATGKALEVQILTSDIFLLRLTGQMLLDTQEARSTARLRMWLAVAVLAALGLIAAIFVQQRRRLELESQQSATLEERVEERTQELKAAQDELMEASNLAALGRLSAGLSHELNQPLAAILNFAENGQRLISRSRNKEASQNLSLIADQIRRITRIIKNLRAFARQEHAPVERVDLGSVTTRALGLMEDQIASSDVVLNVTRPDKPIWVMAGKVRLEQVVTNLVSNALDAMQQSERRELSVTLKRENDLAKLVIADTGTGIEEPERIFEPFYTTKELGASKGLGMGLALCFGLVARFGGQLSCRNLEQGAEFTMTLPHALDEDADMDGEKEMEVA